VIDITFNEVISKRGVFGYVTSEDGFNLGKIGIEQNSMNTQ